MSDITMPRLSDTMEEGTIAKWLKQPGDEVGRGDVVAQIETDKATMDLTSFEAGTLQEILAPEGTTVGIGQPVARLGAGSGAPKALAATQPAPAAAPAASRAAAPTQTDGQPPPATSPGDDSGGGSAAVGAPASGPPPAAAPSTNGAGAGGRMRASPLARRMAQEHGVDLASVRGSGPEGRVVRADVEAALAGGSKPAEVSAAQATAPAPPMASPASGGLSEDETVPLSQMRRAIARRMAESTRTVPHFFLTTTVDATELVKLRKQLVTQIEAGGDDAGPRISINDLVVKAVATALRQVPEVNVSYADDNLVRHARVNVGVAVALDNGLIVPVLRDVDQKSVGQISRDTRDLVARARAGKLQPQDYSGGTFTVSNLGMFGVEQFNAVINPPEAGILAVGAVVREPAEYQGEIALRDRMRVTLSIDHRALDGAGGARYLQALRRLLEQPMLLLL